MPKKIDRFFAAAIIFLNGWNWALPLPSFPVPVWFKPVEVIHGIFTHELLLIIYLGVLLERKRSLPIRDHGVGDKIARLLFWLGVLGIFSNGLNFQPLKEMGEAGRFFLLAVFFLMSIYWAKRHGPTLVLQSLCIGIACAGVINLYYSFAIHFGMVGGFPFLLGQKGPGGSMGLMVIFSAWLMMEQKKVLNSTVLLVLAGIGVFGASISYSKLAMSMAGFGLVAWGFVLFGNLFKRQSRRPTVVMIVVLLSFTWYFSVSLIQYVHGVDAFIIEKFDNVSERISVKGRFAYLPSTFEIMLHHPLFGVGYSGFYDAITKTETYKTNKWSVKEDQTSGKEGKSNPHNAFLYYASANGVPGLFLSIFLFISICREFWRHFSTRGFTGRGIGICLICAYVVFGTTVYTLLNTSIMYIPAAVAIAYNHKYSSTPHQVSQTERHKRLQQGQHYF